MNPEQFIFWLSGYFTAASDNDHNVVLKDIKYALEKVKLDTSSIVYFGGNP